MNYKELALGIVEFAGAVEVTEEDIESFKRAKEHQTIIDNNIKDNNTLRVIKNTAWVAYGEQDRHILKSFQSKILTALAMYCDIYTEAIHPIQWQEKIQLDVLSSGNSYVNKNNVASVAGKDYVIDNTPFSRQVIVMLFLNDDYQGGELYWNYFKDLTYKPKSGTILIMPASFMWTHSAKTILKGERYSLFTAFHGGKDYEGESYEEEQQENLMLTYMR